jgi:protein-cysteine N-palmitoyltransferase HHAT
VVSITLFIACFTLNKLQDNSDGQYRTVRNNLPILTAIAIAFFGLKFIWTRIYTAEASTKNNLYLIPFHLACSILFLLGLTGANILKIFTIITLHYLLSKSVGGTRFGPLIIWTYNLIILFSNDRYSGYRYADIFPPLAFLVNLDANFILDLYLT